MNKKVVFILLIINILLLVSCAKLPVFMRYDEINETLSPISASIVETEEESVKKMLIETIKRIEEPIDEIKETVATQTNVEKKKKAYLTFDDGPGKYTDKFLELFDEYNIKVTYFVTYDNEERRKKIKKIYDKGHTIGVHSYRHKPEIIYINEEAYATDLAKILTVVKEVTGSDAKYIRFPFGSNNSISKFNPGIMTRLTKYVTDLGYKYFDWNVYGDDGKSGNMDYNEVYKLMVSQLKGLDKEQDAIILCHDANLHTYEAVKLLIPYLIENDYNILPITDDTIAYHSKLVN